jgi:hypothetical protein
MNKKRSIIKIDNLLSKSEINDIDNELIIITENNNATGGSNGKGFERYDRLNVFNQVIWGYSRAFIDNIFDGKREKSKILKILSGKLFSQELYNKFPIDDDEPLLRLIPFSNRHETQYTVYDKGGEYTWHIDSDLPHNRIANYIYYINDDFVGGELELSFQRDIIMVVDDNQDNYDEPLVSLTITPKKNTLVVIPSDMLHRVKPITKGKRRTINGHIGFK